MDKKFIADKVDELIDRFNKTYQSDLLQNKKDLLIDIIEDLIFKKLVTEEHELEIRIKILSAINYPSADYLCIKKNIPYYEQILKYYGDQIGGFILYFNKCFNKILKHESDEYNKKLKNN